MLVFLKTALHENLALEDDFDPVGTSSEMSDDLLKPGSSSTLAGLKSPPRGTEDTEARAAGHVDSLMGLLIDFEDLKTIVVSIELG